jgi:hypothetical protein
MCASEVLTAGNGGLSRSALFWLADFSLSLLVLISTVQLRFSGPDLPIPLHCGGFIKDPFNFLVILPAVLVQV